MPKDVLRLGVVAASHPPATRWGERVLRPVAVMKGLPEISEGMRMSERDGVETLYLGDHALILHSGETGHYIDNLKALRPSIWVALNDAKVFAVTADPYEGEALASDPDRIVEAVAMPASLMAWIDAFIATHHVEEVFYKRKRVPATSASDPRAPRILNDAEKWTNTRGRSGLGPGWKD